MLSFHQKFGTLGAQRLEEDLFASQGFKWLRAKKSSWSIEHATVISIGIEDVNTLTCNMYAYTYTYTYVHI